VLFGNSAHIVLGASRWAEPVIKGNSTTTKSAASRRYHKPLPEGYIYVWNSQSHEFEPVAADQLKSGMPTVNGSS
jgi:hypothetical protein